MKSEEVLWFWLSGIPGVGPVTVHDLLGVFGSPGEIFDASEKALNETGLLKAEMLQALTGSRNEILLQKHFDAMLKKEIHFISFSSPEYPEVLRSIYDPPIALYVKGSLPETNELVMAVVGGRRCTASGRAAAHSISRGIAFSGVSVISGMARGIDSAAHRGCLDGFGRTYAVLGCGVDLCYPKENIELYEEIQKNGGLISEFPPGTPPRPWRFPVRNRLIAALSQGILLVDARRQSGSLITAERGLEMGKEIFAVPGRIDDALSEGCNLLIRDGARLVMSHEDILDYFSLVARGFVRQQPAPGKKAGMVYRSLSLVPASADDIAARTGLPVREVMIQLADLEMDHLITCLGKNQYVLKV